MSVIASALLIHNPEKMYAYVDLSTKITQSLNEMHVYICRIEARALVQDKWMLLENHQTKNT